MGLEIYWLELAENKLEDIFGYYTVKANKKVAEKLVRGIIDTTFGIENQPEIGQIEISLKHRKEDFRYLVFKNYHLLLNTITPHVVLPAHSGRPRNDKKQPVMQNGEKRNEASFSLIS